MYTLIQYVPRQYRHLGLFKAHKYHTEAFYLHGRLDVVKQLTWFDKTWTHIVDDGLESVPQDTYVLHEDQIEELHPDCLRRYSMF